MAELEQTFIAKKANEPEEVHDEFRCWISAEPHPKFPIGLLHMSIKVTNEAPAGVRAGLKGSYAWLTQDNMDAISGTSSPTWRTMLYALCFMHTVVQERRKVRRNTHLHDGLRRQCPGSARIRQTEAQTTRLASPSPSEGGD